MFQANKLSICQNSQTQPNLSKDYVRTKDEQKLQLIDLVINEKYSMKLASEIVGVKLSTVKYIIKAYKTNKQEFMEKLKPKKDKIQKEKRSQISRNQNIKVSVPFGEIEKKQVEVQNQQNPSREQFFNQQTCMNHFQNNMQFQMILNQNQFWSTFMGWDNNYLFGFNGN